MPDGFIIYAETVEDEDKLHYCTDDIPVTPDSDGRVFIQLNSNTPTCTPGRSSLKPHRRYNITITAKNEDGETNSTGYIPFSKPSFILNATSMHIENWLILSITFLCALVTFVKF